MKFKERLLNQNIKMFYIYKMTTNIIVKIENSKFYFKSNKLTIKNESLKVIKKLL